MTKNNPSSKRFGSTARIVTLIILLMILSCTDLFLLGVTIVSKPLAIIIALAFAIISGIPALPLWSRITGSDKRWLCYLTHVVVTAPLAMCIFLSINLFATPDSRFTDTKTVVTRIYSETRHTTRRVSRRTYVQGDPYKVYFAEVCLPSGRLKSISINNRQFRRLHKGDTITLKIGRGALGLPVIRRRGVTVNIPESHYRVR